MTLLVKDEKTDINEVYLMTIKFSSNSYQYKGVKRANRYSTKGFIMGEEEFHEKGRGGGGYSGSWGGGTYRDRWFTNLCPLLSPW